MKNGSTERKGSIINLKLQKWKRMDNVNGLSFKLDKSSSPLIIAIIRKLFILSKSAGTLKVGDAENFSKSRRNI